MTWPVGVAVATVVVAHIGGGGHRKEEQSESFENRTRLHFETAERKLSIIV